MTISYTKHGDYYYPDLVAPQERYEIGRFGNLYLQHIKKNRPSLYSQLKIKGTLLKHVANIDKSARAYYDRLIQHFAKSAPPRENQMEWVGYMNNARHMAEEFVLEFIYEE